MKRSGESDRVFTYSYDTAGRFEWTYDDSGNRESMLEVTTDQASKWEYVHDYLDRLVSVKRASADSVAQLPADPLGVTHRQREYVFDESDNRVYQDDYVNSATYYYTYQSYNDDDVARYSDQLKEIFVSNTPGDRNFPTNFTLLESFEHDADGNMTVRHLANGELINQPGLILIDFSESNPINRVDCRTIASTQPV
ncbi:MAG: hypothetical protein WC314_23975 [Vulcanimicrobiota bacterium]